VRNGHVRLNHRSDQIAVAESHLARNPPGRSFLTGWPPACDLETIGTPAPKVPAKPPIRSIIRCLDIVIREIEEMPQ
jgi:hypothetical protein